MKIKDLFVVRATNEENNDFIISIGKYLATEKRFKTKEEAENYIKYPKWDTIGALIGTMIEANKLEEEMKKDVENSIAINTKEDE